MFFFFQAEDGIRDLYVTGVQTCALPILLALVLLLPAAAQTTTLFASALASADSKAEPRLPSPPRLMLTTRAPFAIRSEERRVAKEWKSRETPATFNASRSSAHTATY